MATLEQIFQNSDLGGRTIKQVVQEAVKPEPDFSKFDLLTQYIAGSFTDNVGEIDGFISDIDYAIDQFKRAKLQAERY